MQEQVAEKSVIPAPDSPIAIRRRAWRQAKDQMAKYGIAVGGVSVILAILLIFFYLLYVVVPMFQSADVEETHTYSTSIQGTKYIALNEYNDVALSVTDNGLAHFFAVESGESILDVDLGVDAPQISTVTAGSNVSNVYAYGLNDGQALLFNHKFRVTYPEGTTRVIVPSIEYPLGEQPIVIDAEQQAIKMLAAQSFDGISTFAALTADGRLLIKAIKKEESFLDEDEFELIER